jgi:molybdate transport system ATP-binding protein
LVAVAVSLDAYIRTGFPGGLQIDVTLEGAPGATTALLGPNGAGKSTILSVVAGHRELQGGRISLGGEILDDPAAGIFVAPERRGIGMVFQDGVLFPHLSAVDNVAFGLRPMGKTEARRLAAGWLERVGLSTRQGSKAGELSGGEAQRVALARALAPSPRLLLLDEPMSALDHSARTQMRRLLTEHLSGLSIPRILVTHDPAEAFLLADHIVVVEAGRITQAGTASHLRSRPRSRYVADLVGINLFEGQAQGGIVTVGLHRLYIADQSLTGQALAAIRPQAIALSDGRPAGSARNVWETTILHLERYEDRMRVVLSDPLPIVAEVTLAAAHELGLAVGRHAWVAIKATEIAAEAM